MNGSIGIFVDIALAAVLLLALVMGWRQGFVQALTRIVVVVAALLLAGWIAGKLADSGETLPGGSAGPQRLLLGAPGVGQCPP